MSCSGGVSFYQHHPGSHHQHPLRKQTASSPGSLIINSTPAIFDTVSLSLISPLCCGQNGCVGRGIRPQLNCARPGSSSEHTFHQHIATLGRLTLLHHCSLMLLNCKERSEKKARVVHVTFLRLMMHFQGDGGTGSTTWVQMVLVLCGKCKSRKSTSRSETQRWVRVCSDSLRGEFLCLWGLSSPLWSADEPCTAV